ncbi:MAG: NCS1 family nucleobase:cation symporter-1, partial [Candidatus Eisenbacteria bacterium]
MDPNQIQLPDGRVELLAVAPIQSSPLYNHDLAPVPVARRTWSTYNYAALWISMAHCIPTYMLASGLMAQGMNWQQALFTILLGNTIVLVPILLNSHPGTKYGIPFPVFARAAYGTAGSNLPALMRALVACGWFGIQTWIGGEALQTLFAALVPGWKGRLGLGFAGHTTTEWLSFMLFWGLNICIIYRGMDLLRKVENWAAPYVLVVTLALLAWAVKAAHGLGPLLSQPGKFGTLREFLPVFVPSLTAMIGFWATLSLNMPDFTRFGRSQREQVIGQAVALPTTMFAFAAMGVLITSATAIVYGEAIWDPVKLVGKFGSPLVVGFAMFSVVVATRERAAALDQLQDRRPHHRPDRDRHAAVAAARRPPRLHLRVAGRILGRAGLDRRRAGGRLLDRAAARPAPRRSLSAPRDLRRLEHPGRDRHPGRLRAGLGRAHPPGAAPALRLRLVRGILRRR